MTTNSSDSPKPSRRAHPSKRVERVPVRLDHLLAALEVPAFIEVGHSTCSRRTRSPSLSHPGCDQARTVCGR